MFKIIQASLQQYVNCECPDVQAGFRKGRGTEIKFCWIIQNIISVGSYKKQGNSRKTSTSAFLTARAFECVDHNKMWDILKEMGIPYHLTCLLRNLYAGQGATVLTGHGTTDWFQIGKGVRQGCILSPCLFILFAEYIMWNAGLDEEQAGIKIARRNNKNLIYAEDTTLWTKGELKQKRIKEPLDESERGEWKSWLKAQHSGN